jgi:hypothetical protein
MENTKMGKGYEQIVIKDEVPGAIKHEKLFDFPTSPNYKSEMTMSSIRLKRPHDTHHMPEEGSLAHCWWV